MESWQGFLSHRKISILKKTWAHTFLTDILPNLPVEELAKHYSENLGRPTKDLTTSLGVALLQQIFNLTDEATLDALAFNQQWHYALDTFDPKEQVMAEKTLWTIRYHLISNNTGHDIFNLITDKFADKFNVDTSKQRMDSVHVYSNMAILGRVRLMTRATTKFLINLKRHQIEYLKKDIPQELIQRYIDPKLKSYFGNVKPSESQLRLPDIAKDMQFLIEKYSGDTTITDMYSYKLLQRIISEQCVIVEGQANIKPAKDVSSTCLQNPSDIDAGYDTHKGPGYQVQLAETYNDIEENSDEVEKEPVLDLITYVKVESAAEHDSKALQPAIDELEERNMKPDEMLVDTLYGSDSNVTKAKEKNVTIVAPVYGKKSKKNFNGFVFNFETYELLECPNGKHPKSITENKTATITAKWNKEDCMTCPLKTQCITKKTKQGRKLEYTKKIIRLWKRREYENSEEFRNKYRFRAGIEATNARYIHQTGARRVRYRGQKRVEFTETIKALGINLFRVVKYIAKKGKFRPEIVNLLNKIRISVNISNLMQIFGMYLQILRKNTINQKI